MGQRLVRHLEDDVKAKLQRRARAHDRSTEAEVRDILCDAARAEHQPPASLGSRLAARFTGIGLVAEIPELRGHRAGPADLAS